MVLHMNIKSKAMMLKEMQEEKRRQLEERRRQFLAAQNSRKAKAQSALLKSFRDIGDAMVSLVTSPNSPADRLKRRRDAYRYNKAQIQKLTAVRDAYRLSLTGIVERGRVYSGASKVQNGASYRYGRQNTPPQKRRVNPALVRFMIGRGSR